MGDNGKKAWDIPDEKIALVESMAAAGLTNDQMAAILGVHEKTFRRALKKNKKAQAARDAGQATAIYNVAGKLYDMAVSGKNPAATFFYLKTRAGWRETNRMEHVGEDGKPIETKNQHTIKMIVEDYRDDEGSV